MRYWALIKDNQVTSVESYSHDLDLSKDKLEITEEEYDIFIKSLPAPVKAKTEVELLTEKVTSLETRLAKVETTAAVEPVK